MALKINRETIEHAWNSCLDIAAFTGVGYLSGRAVNGYVKWTSVPSIFKKSVQVDLTSIAVCCALFATIDRLAHFILSSFAGSYEVNKPVYSALRIGASAAAAISLFNGLASKVKLPSVETQPAVAVIVTAMVIYGQILIHLASFNGRYGYIESHAYLDV